MNIFSSNLFQKVFLFEEYRLNNQTLLAEHSRHQWFNAHSSEKQSYNFEEILKAKAWLGKYLMRKYQSEHNNKSPSNILYLKHLFDR